MRYGPNTSKKFSLPSYCLHHLSPFSVLCLPLGTKGTSLGCNFHLNLFCKRYRILHFFTERVLWHYLERCSFWPNKSVPMPQTTPSLCYHTVEITWNICASSASLCLLLPQHRGTDTQQQVFITKDQTRMHLKTNCGIYFLLRVCKSWPPCLIARPTYCVVLEWKASRDYWPGCWACMGYKLLILVTLGIQNCFSCTVKCLLARNGWTELKKRITWSSCSCL